MNLLTATWEAQACLTRMERKLAQMGLPGPTCRLSMHSLIGTATIYFTSPDKVLVARDKVILLSKADLNHHMATAMANCACQRFYLIKLHQYETHPIPSKVPKPILHGQGSMRWNQYFIKLLSC